MRSSLIRLIPGLLAIGVAVSPVDAQRDNRVRETVFEQQFDVAAGDRLVVKVGDMDVRIEAGSTARVEVFASARDQAFAREVFDEMRFSARAAGGQLLVETTDPRNNSRDWRDWQRRGGASFEAVITIPSRFNLDVQTGDGDVVVASFEGAADIRTGDGDVLIESLRGPSISLHTGDGDVQARVLEATTISLDTGDGDLWIAEASGAVTARTGDGDVSIGIGRFAGLSIRTGDGDVSVSADPSIAANVEVDGEDLSLARAFALSGRVSDDHLSGTLNGGGPELRIRTGDGSISIRVR